VESIGAWDDKYPIQLVTDKIGSLISHAMRSPEVDGLFISGRLPGNAE